MKKEPKQLDPFTVQITAALGCDAIAVGLESRELNQVNYPGEESGRWLAGLGQYFGWGSEKVDQVATLGEVCVADSFAADLQSTHTGGIESPWIERWCFAFFGFSYSATRFLGGLFGVGFVVAWLSTIPLLQIASLGFLVEATRRVSISGRLRDGIVGREKGWLVAKLMAGVALSLVPLNIASTIRYDAWLISPTSDQYANLRVIESILFVATILHLLGAGLCGGKLRHFVWPILLPWYLASGLAKRVLRLSWFRYAVQQTIGRLFPKTVENYYHLQRLSEWFVPAVLLSHLRKGTLLSVASERFWDFVFSLRIGHYLKQGLVAFLGMVVWFAGPTLWLLIATRSAAAGAQGVCFFLGLVHLFLVLSYFPLVHSRYCQTLDWRAYYQWRIAGRRFQYSPLRISVALLFSILLSSPLWLTRIAMIPYELWWVLSAVYVAMLWPTWTLWGWAWHHASGYRASNVQATQIAAAKVDHGQNTAERSLVLEASAADLGSELGSELAIASQCLPVGRCRWYWIWPFRLLFSALVLLQLGLTLLSIYLCWQGVFNVMLHPMFHIPTPFGINA